jgi:cytoskeletal protein CcmA (bactofilin family)
MRSLVSRHTSRHRTNALRLSLVFALVALTVVVLPGRALAQSTNDDRKAQVVLTGRIDVLQGERTGSVVIFDGPAVIAGDVKGSVVALNGNVRVTGTVTDNVVAVKGRAVVDEGATVGGDVMSSRRPVIAPGATVKGDVRTENFANYFRALGWFLWFAWWVAVSVSVFVLGLLFLGLAPRALHAGMTVARSHVGAAIGWGLAMAIGLPIVSVLLLVTLIGIPLGLIGLLSLALLYGLGYALSALVLGRRLIKEPRGLVLAFSVGLLILRVIDLIPLIGNLVTFAATVFGLGALTVAGWRAARGSPVVRHYEVAPGVTGSPTG